MCMTAIGTERGVRDVNVRACYGCDIMCVTVRARSGTMCMTAMMEM